ncbi:MAG: PspA/IM30 family protein [Terriglobus sp.]
MALLERVSTLLRANLNDLMDKAEDPAKMLKQLVLDMENQLLQVKTRVAIAVADQHILEAKKKEHEEAMAAWRKKAELALQRDDEPLARAALERSLQSEQLLTGYVQQLDDQRAETETLREHYRQLQTKLEETSAQAELLLHQHRRARQAPLTAKTIPVERGIARMRSALLQQQADTVAARTVESLNQDTVAQRLSRMERDQRIEELLRDLSNKPHQLRDHND